MTVDESKQYIRDRISVLRTEKGVSEYRMSQELGHSKGYIQAISSGKSLPSMEGFLCICEYLDVSTRDFFDSEVKSPTLQGRLDHLIEELSSEEVTLLVNFAEVLVEKNSGPESGKIRVS